MTGKSKKKCNTAGGSGSGSSGGERRGMDIFLVFFRQEHQQNVDFSPPSSSLSSPFKFPTINSFFKRTNSSQILSRVQSTISICALLIFLTLLLFTLSTFEPNSNLTLFHHRNSHTTRRRALQRLGTLYTRGTTAMNDLILCHVTDSVTTKELKLFLRAFHTSGLASNSDLLFIFNSVSTPDSFNNVILEEFDIFLKVISRYKSELCNGSKVLNFPASFDPTRFVKSGKKVVHRGEPIWGGKIKSNNSSLDQSGNETESTRMNYGSVVGFGVGELDPENSLFGFMDQVPMSLRRWACYPMILGRVRRKYKHVMLVDVKKVLLLGDPLARVKNHSPDSVFLSSTNHKTINPAVIMGGVRGLRRLSAAMVTEIVRATMTQQRNKRKNSVTESSLLRHLATNEFASKSMRIVKSAESIPEASELSGSLIGNQTIVGREIIDSDTESIIMKHICSFLICSFPIDSELYTDC